MSTSAPDYPADYVELTFTTDEQTLADDAVAALQTTWTDWEPNDGDIEVVLIETLAPYASAAIAQASQMPPAAFIALGTKLYGIPYAQGTPASTTITLTFQDDAGGYYVPAGSEFDLSGYAFSTVLDVTSTAGSDTATGVEIIANDVGVAFNDLTDADWASVTLPVWIVDLATEAPTSGGVDPQDDYDYLNMMSRELQLRGRMLVTLPDLEIAAVDTAGVGRAYAQTNAARDVTVYLTDPDGNPVASDIKDALLVTYQAATLVNVSFTLADANYTIVDVTYAVVHRPGFDPVMLEQAIDATLSSTLTPNNWQTVSLGQPGSGPGEWFGDSTIYLNQIIAIIGNVPGVYRVETVQLNGSAADLTMLGPVALPQPGTMVGTVDTLVLT